MDRSLTVIVGITTIMSVPVLLGLLVFVVVQKYKK